MNPANTFLPYFRKSILILSSHLCLRRPKSFFPSDFLTGILYKLLIFPMRAICSTRLITLIIFGEAVNLRSSSLCSLLQPPPPHKIYVEVYRHIHINTTSSGVKNYRLCFELPWFCGIKYDRKIAQISLGKNMS